MLAYVEQSSHRFPAELLIGHNARDKRFFDLHRVEIATGRSELFYENRGFAALATDSAFRLRLAGRFRENGSNEWLERRESGTGVPLFTIGIGDLDGRQLLGFSDDGATLYLLDSRGRAFLEERSPLTHIERAFRPILIAQGLEDVRVTPAESAQMVAALKSRNVPVTYITFPDEGHGFQRPENAIALQAVAEAFLARHLGGAADPFDRARDFKGSTLTVETGGELIPGLGG